MLEESKKTMANAPAHERVIAELIAFRYIACELEENLISSGEAAKIARAHRDEADETWLRAVHGILTALRYADSQGYRLLG